MSDSIMRDILLQALAWLFLAGAAVGLIVGGMLIMYPDRLHRLNSVLNRWVSTRRLEAPLERAIPFDPWLYRHHRLGATLILLGVGYLLHFVVGLDSSAWIGPVAAQFGLPRVVAAWLLDAGVLVALCGAVLAGWVGVFLLFRPSALRDFEGGANRWISLRRGMKPLEIQRSALDEFVMHHARHTGMVLVAASLLLLVLLATWIRLL